MKKLIILIAVIALVSCKKESDQAKQLPIPDAIYDEYIVTITHSTGGSTQNWTVVPRDSISVYIKYFIPLVDSLTMNVSGNDLTIPQQTFPYFAMPGEFIRIKGSGNFYHNAIYLNYSIFYSVTSETVDCTATAVKK